MVRLTTKEIVVGSAEDTRLGIFTEAGPQYRIEWEGDVLFRGTLQWDTRSRMPQRPEVGEAAVEHFAGMTLLDFLESTEEEDRITSILMTRLLTPLAVSGHPKVVLVYHREGLALNKAAALVESWDLDRPLSTVAHRQLNPSDTNELFHRQATQVYHLVVVSRATREGREYHFSVRATKEPPQYRVDTRRVGGEVVWPKPDDCALLHDLNLFIVKPDVTSVVSLADELNLIRQGETDALASIYADEDLLARDDRPKRVRSAA